MNETGATQRVASEGHLTVSLLHAAQAVTDRLESALDRVGLSMAKQSALTKLAEAHEPLTLSELAAKLSCVRSNITQLVDRLEADGLVRRVGDPADRRTVRAELTPIGLEKQAAGAAEIEKVQEAISERLATSDIASLEAALATLS